MPPTKNIFVNPMTDRFSLGIAIEKTVLKKPISKRKSTAGKRHNHIGTKAIHFISFKRELLR